MADAPTREISTQVASRLPMPKAVGEQFGIKAESWKVLTEAIFPSATDPQAVVLALAYCKSRNLDIFKRPIHIVPVWDSKRGAMVETIWPGIGELRTTAARTGTYAGKDKTNFGPMKQQTFRDDKGEVTVEFPEWAQITGYRMVQGVRCAFEGPKVYWLESYATRSNKSDVPNGMWSTRSIGQIEKCAEAAFLRCAFPEEIGNVYAAEEIEGKRVETVKDAHTGEIVKDEGPKRKVVEPPKVETPNEAPAPPQSNTWRGQVKAVTQEKTAKNPRIKVTGADGSEFFTFSQTFGKTAAEGKATGEEVVIEWKLSQYGKDIVNLQLASAADAPPSEEIEPE